MAPDLLDLRVGAGGGFGAGWRPWGCCEVDHSVLRGLAVLKQRLGQNSPFLAAGMVCEGKGGRGGQGENMGCEVTVPASRFLCRSGTLGKTPNLPKTQFPKLENGDKNFSLRVIMTLPDNVLSLSNGGLLQR